MYSENHGLLKWWLNNSKMLSDIERFFQPAAPNLLPLISFITKNALTSSVFLSFDNCQYMSKPVQMFVEDF